MSWCRGILSACALAAAAAQAQQMTELVRTGVWRTIDVPPVAAMAEVTPVPEIHIAPGTATMLVLPVDIAGRVVVGFDGAGQARARLTSGQAIPDRANRTLAHLPTHGLVESVRSIFGKEAGHVT